MLDGILATVEASEPLSAILRPVKMDVLRIAVRARETSAEPLFNNLLIHRIEVNRRTAVKFLAEI